MVNLYFPLDSSSLSFVWARRKTYLEDPFWQDTPLVVLTLLLWSLIAAGFVYTIFLFTRPTIKFRFRRISGWVLLHCRAKGIPLHRVPLYTRLAQLPLFITLGLVVLYGVLVMAVSDRFLLGVSSILGGPAMIASTGAIIHSLYGSKRRVSWYLPVHTSALFALYLLQLLATHIKIATVISLRLPYLCSSYTLLVVHLLVYNQRHHRNLPTVFSGMVDRFFDCCHTQGDPRELRIQLVDDLKAELPEKTVQEVLRGYALPFCFLTLMVLDALLIDVGPSGLAFGSVDLDVEIVLMCAICVLVVDIILLLFRAAGHITSPTGLSACAVLPRAIMVLNSSTHWLLYLSMLIFFTLMLLAAYVTFQVAQSWNQSPLSSFASGVATAAALKTSSSRATARDKVSKFAASTVGWIFDWNKQSHESRNALLNLGAVTTVLLGTLLLFGIYSPQIGNRPLVQLRFINSIYDQDKFAYAVCAIAPGYIATLVVVARLYFTPDSAKDSELPWKSVGAAVSLSMTGGSIISAALNTSDSALSGFMSFYLPNMLILLVLYQRRLRIQDYCLFFFGAKTPAELEIEDRLAGFMVDVEEAIQAQAAKDDILLLHASVEATQQELADLRNTQPTVVPSGVYLVCMALSVVLNTIGIVLGTDVPWVGYTLLGSAFCLYFYYEAGLRFLRILQFDPVGCLMLGLGSTAVIFVSIVVYFTQFNTGGALSESLDQLFVFGIPSVILGVLLVGAGAFKWKHDSWMLFGRDGKSMTTLYCLLLGHGLVAIFAVLLGLATSLVAGLIAAGVDAASASALVLVQKKIENDNVLPRPYELGLVLLIGAVAVWGGLDGILIDDYFLAATNTFYVVLVPVMFIILKELVQTVYMSKSKVTVVLTYPGSVLPIYVYDPLRENQERLKLRKANSLFLRMFFALMAIVAWAAVGDIFLEHNGVSVSTTSLAKAALVLLVLQFTWRTGVVFANTFRNSGFDDELVADLFEQALLTALKEEIPDSQYDAEGTDTNLTDTVKQMHKWRRAKDLELEEMALLDEVMQQVSSLGGAAVAPASDDWERQLDKKIARLQELPSEISIQAAQEQDCEAHAMALCVVMMKHKNRQRNRTLLEVLRQQGIQAANFDKLTDAEQKTLNHKAAVYLEERDHAREAEVRRLRAQTAKLEKQQENSRRIAMEKQEAFESQMMARMHSEHAQQNIDAAVRKYLEAAATCDREFFEYEQVRAKEKGWTAFRDPTTQEIVFRKDSNPTMTLHGSANDLFCRETESHSDEAFEAENTIAQEKGWEAFRSSSTGEIGFRLLSNPRIISYGLAADLDLSKPKPPRLLVAAPVRLAPMGTKEPAWFQQKQRFRCETFTKEVDACLDECRIASEKERSERIAEIEEHIAAVASRSDVSAAYLNRLTARRAQLEDEARGLGHSCDLKVAETLTSKLDEIGDAYAAVLRRILEHRILLARCKDEECDGLLAQLEGLDHTLQQRRAESEAAQLAHRISETKKALELQKRIEQESRQKQYVDYHDSLESWEDGIIAQTKALGNDRWDDPEFGSDQALFVSGEKDQATVFDETQTRAIASGSWNRLLSETGAPVAFSVPSKDGLEFSVDEPKQSDYLGNCWLISAIATVATRPEALDKIFVKQSEMGAYGLRLFNQGHQTLVTVDDKFLCDSEGVPVFAKSYLPEPPEPELVGTLKTSAAPNGCEPSEMRSLWPMLLEKAFAKQFHCYEALEGGHVHEALAVMCSGCSRDSDDVAGVPQEIMINNQDVQANIANGSLFATLLQYSELGFLMGAGSPEGSDATSIDGIIQGHGYSILEVRVVRGAKLIQLRNPWGSGVEWEGEFSDRWLRVHGRRFRKLLGWEAQGADSDGTFWMSFGDFVTHFSQIYLCRLFDRSWITLTEHGVWSGASAVGGARVCDSPQWLIHVRQPVQLVVVLTQDKMPIDELLPLWLGLYNFGPRQNDPAQRDRLFKVKRLRIAKSPTWKMARTIVLEIPRLEASDDESTPYVLAVSALAEGHRRSFGVQICVRPVYPTALDEEVIRIEKCETKEDETTQGGMTLADKGWLSTVARGEWTGQGAVGGEHIHDSPQWMVHLTQPMTVKITLTQDCPDNEAIFPLWLAVYKLGPSQRDPEKRARLFRYRRLRVGAMEAWSSSREVSLQIDQLEPCESTSSPYVLVAGAMAEGQHRAFTLEVCVKPVSKAVNEEADWTSSVAEDLDPHLKDTLRSSSVEESVEVWERLPRPCAWKTQVTRGEWTGAGALGGEHIHDSPQWLLHVSKPMTVKIILTQDRNDHEEVLPLWLAVYKLGPSQRDPEKRARLFRYRRLRVGAMEAWSSSREVSLHIDQLEPCETSSQYVLVAGAMAEGQHRTFDLTICATPIDNIVGGTCDVTAWQGDAIGPVSPLPTQSGPLERSKTRPPFLAPLIGALERATTLPDH